jgi:hypothetical protein
LYLCCWFTDIRLISFGGEWRGGLLRVYSDADGPGVFMAKDADAVGVKGSGNSISVKVETSLAAFLEDFHTWGLFLSCQSIRISG